MTQSQEAYMLRRDQDESRRLDVQHQFLRALAHGHLIQPSVPKANLRAIADVGTGTGVWLREVAEEMTAQAIDLKGFDISSQQFPSKSFEGPDCKTPNTVEYIVQDVVDPFPQQYHQTFDLVHVRLMTYALKAKDLTNAVKNVVDIIRPGGYLQWQECDTIDAWAIPDTRRAKLTISYLVAERLARGLTTALVSPLIKILQSFSKPVLPGMISPMHWTDDTMRIMQLETISTLDHPEEAVQALRKRVLVGSAVQLLQAGVARRESILEQEQLVNRQQITNEVILLKELIDAWSRGEDPASNDWHGEMTSIVARKSIVFGEHDSWMARRHAKTSPVS